MYRIYAYAYNVSLQCFPCLHRDAYNRERESTQRREYTIQTSTKDGLAFLNFSNLHSRQVKENGKNSEIQMTPESD